MHRALACRDRATPGAAGGLSSGLRDRVLARLGFTVPPPVTLDGLNALYRAWGREIPFDNLQKRLALAAGPSVPLPGAEPDEFFARYLADGTAATCWPSSVALHALLRGCGFDAVWLAGTMLPSGVDHGSVLARLADAALLVDTWMASETALPLTDAATDAGVGACRVRAEPHGSLWRVWYLHPAREDECCFEIREYDVPLDRVRRGYESSRTNSRFNTRVFARKNVAGGVLCITRGARHVRDASGLTRRDLAPADLTRALREEFGYSRDIVARLPPDEPADDPPPLVGSAHDTREVRT